ncbi:hypothetical protein C4D60_Mb01t17600 [Musa balbisiana]|uniref:histone deacetylase n=1 Tax=Musa balbisiana TaxID=52838 RepID=A0A4S8JMY0_MUSBA|nr:hypothetical protein C4D60_Mb01t17600 [Musa balbisiana]
MDVAGTSGGGSSLPSVGTDATKRKVCYFYHPTMGNFYYGNGHPMKPHRVRMTHALLEKYGLLRHMRVLRPIPAHESDFCRFHADDYIAFLRTANSSVENDPATLRRFNIDDVECPIFHGLYKFCQLYAGASISAARQINLDHYDIVINWSGGLHHAKKSMASGFCYVNDVVLAILSLLETRHVGPFLFLLLILHHRLCIFLLDSVNVPLDDGIDDESYLYVFKPVVAKAMEVFRPKRPVVLFQCGADSLSGGSATDAGRSLPSVGTDATKRKVCYFYHPTMGNFYYGNGHPMKPHRVRMTHALLEKYGLLRHMRVLRPIPAHESDFCRFHADDYIAFLRTANSSVENDPATLRRFNIDDVECPIFHGLYKFCQLYAGASISAARQINLDHYDIVINWSGGLHHAKKSMASGFCYVNDVVLAILSLLETRHVGPFLFLLLILHHRLCIFLLDSVYGDIYVCLFGICMQRVLYVDIDIHHGDGVEEAFYTTDRVMTVSFHKFGGYFPGTGHIDDIGCDGGKHYAVNVPLDDGIDDESYLYVFKPVVAKAMEVFRPNAVVLQCGADSLSGDRLGCFNLSVRGHGECVKYMRSFNVPLMLLGGGGYTLHNVARCWCYETGVALGIEVNNKIPDHQYSEYFAPLYRIHLPTTNMANKNSRKSLDDTIAKVLANLSKIQAAPSVQFKERSSLIDLDEIDEDQEDASDSDE